MHKADTAKFPFISRSAKASHCQEIPVNHGFLLVRLNVREVHCGRQSSALFGTVSLFCAEQIFIGFCTVYHCQLPSFENAEHEHLNISRDNERVV